jgi:hypothetical protein
MCLEVLIEGRLVFIVHNGKIDLAPVRRCQFAYHEPVASLPAAGCAGREEARFAVLANFGEISDIPLTHHCGGAPNPEPEAGGQADVCSEG